jgi:hypothetical protein
VVEVDGVVVDGLAGADVVLVGRDEVVDAPIVVVEEVAGAAAGVLEPPTVARAARLATRSAATTSAAARIERRPTMTT